jgi:hypothetical protein
MSAFSKIFSWFRSLLFRRPEDIRVDSDDIYHPKDRRLIKNSLRQWLLENNYEDVASKIDEVIKKWQIQGKRTRRNWWDVLAGDRKGKPKMIEGVEFPVLRAAQIRQGRQISMNAMCRNEHEKLPEKVKKQAIRDIKTLF